MKFDRVGEIAILIGNFHLSVTARTTVSGDSSLRYTWRAAWVSSTQETLIIIIVTARV